MKRSAQKGALGASPPKEPNYPKALRLSDDDQRMLEELHIALNAPKAVILRMALKKMHDELLGVPGPERYAHKEFVRAGGEPDATWRLGKPWKGK